MEEINRKIFERMIEFEMENLKLCDIVLELELEIFV